MDRKKVLIITYYWPPSGGSGVQRWVKFCKYLPEFNIEPVVLTVKNGTYPLIDETLLEQVKDVEVYYTKSIEPYSIFATLTGKSKKEVSTPSTAFSADGNFIKKLGIWVRSNLFIPDARIGWIPFAFSKAKKIIEQENITTIITTGPPNSTHVTGTKLKEWKPELQWIMDMRDPWSQIFYNEDLPRTSIAKSIDEKLERKALQSADEVVVVSPSAVELQEKIYNRSYSVITNGFDHRDFEIIRNISSSKIKRSEKITISYIGSMPESSIPHGFFKALNALTDDSKKKFTLQFIGSYTEQLSQVISKYGLSDIALFIDYLPHLEAKKEMCLSDLLLLVIPDTKMNKQIVPGKIFDYIASQQFICCIGPLNNDASKIIQENGLGQCFSYSDWNGMQNFLFWTSKQDQLGHNLKSSDPLKYHPFSRYILTQKFSKLIK